MSNEQREQFMKHVMGCNGFDLNNEQCRHFFTRFDPKNQYEVTVFLNGEESNHICYLYNDYYHTSMYVFVAPEYIKKIVRIHDNEEIQI